jgi:hypothetical protein
MSRYNDSDVFLINERSSHAYRCGMYIMIRSHFCIRKIGFPIFLAEFSFKVRTFEPFLVN